MSKIIFFNLRTNYGVETIDSVCRNDFESIKDFITEVKRLRNEYHIAGIPAYTSCRATKDWYQQHKNSLL